MSQKMLLDAIKSLEINGLDDDGLDGLLKSLDMIIEMNTFDGLTQQEAFVKLTEVKEVLAIRNSKNLESAAKAAEVKNKKQRKEKERITPSDFVDENVNSDQMKLIELMIQHEDDGSLSFEYRNLKWEWDPNSNAWDYKPLDK
jgi:hypothetical protein